MPTAPKINTPPSFYRVEDIQRMMGISRASAYSLARSKGFPSIRIDSRIVVPIDLFKRLIEEAAASEVK